MVQDVVPPERRSIRDIPLEGRARGPMPARNSDYLPPDERGPMSHTGRQVQQGRKGKLPSVLVWILVVLAGLFLIFSVALLFSGARVVVAVRNLPTVLDSTFVAQKNAPGGGLAYQVMSITQEDRMDIPAEGVEEVAEYASGTIIVYNDFSTSPQKFVPRTRFETPDGKIFLIGNRSITVPGKSVDENGKSVPGSIEVAVTAQAPGKEYNIDLTDFTVPGLKGDPRYNGFYARSKTRMTGGFVGSRPVAEEADIVEAKALLHERLTETLTAQARTQVPDDFILYDDGIFIEFESIVPDESSSSAKDLTVRERGMLHAVIFDRAHMSNYIAEQTIADFDGGEVIVTNLENLEATIPNREQASPWEAQELSIYFQGTPHIEWTFDEMRLKEDLAGQLKSDIDTILSRYPGIEGAEIVIRPFWKDRFPQRSERITIQITR